MGYYLLDHPPASPQYRRPRRQALSGAIGWHTTEGDVELTIGAPNLSIADF